MLCYAKRAGQGDSAAPGVGAVLDLHRMAAPDPGVGGPDEHQGQAGGWDHHLPLPAGKQRGLQSWWLSGQMQLHANHPKDYHLPNRGRQGVWDQ